uniref:ADAM metallopeptidase domain 19b n=1 Tax=Astatotilapia calliptera TaxID=8154 RepID=A0AAX7SH75_ASTCA
MRPGARPPPPPSPPPYAARCCVCVCLIVVLYCTVTAAVSEAAVYNGDTKQASLESILENVESYEITYPIWLHPLRHKRSDNKEHPAEAQVLITTEGQELRLLLEKNEQLLAPGYQEIWYTPNGARKSSSRPSTGHCFYHGEVQGMEGSSVAVSTCSGLRGLISLNTSISYLIEPLPVSTDADRHAVFRAESVRLPGGHCQHHHGKVHFLFYFKCEMYPLWERYFNRCVDVEFLFLCVHCGLWSLQFEKHNSDLDKTKQKLVEAANLVDKYYKALNIRVALIGLEVWTSQDMISVSDNPHSTLAAFLSWRQKQLRSLPNDNAQLVTGKSFRGTTIGLAPLKAMCSEYQSGGVNMDHSDLSVGVAATMAHEMGHNFGMSHDIPGCCQAKAEDGGCIMAAATGDPFPRVFNDCNIKELKSYLSSGGGKCLFNLPNTRTMYGGHRCGNGYLEDGEECDSGFSFDGFECTSPCCNANNCTLKAGAECAHGVCCQNCKLKSPGVLCRALSGSCDLPEFCDGKTESCPADFYLVDGTSCAGGKAYCYTGMCLTLEQQCRSLWGKDGRPAPDLCFKRVNEAGNMYGNCGKDESGNYRSCSDRNAKCGKIQCLASASKPIEQNAVVIETTVTEGYKRIMCKGTHVYKLDKEEKEAQGDTLDPGLVMTGTKCGEDLICFNGLCRNASFLRAAECNAKCHGHGLCNNNRNCHCDPGWAPPLCDQKGSGGSVDSGPVINRSETHAPIIYVQLIKVKTIFLVFVYFLTLVYFIFQQEALVQPSLLPFCFSWWVWLFLLFGASPSPHPSPSAPPLPRNGIVYPAGKPPPVPMCAGEQRKQTPQPQRVISPQGRTPPVPPGQKPNQASALPTRPPPLRSLDAKNSSQLSAVPKNRPNPPNRPPPPCPIKKQSGVNPSLLH